MKLLLTVSKCTLIYYQEDTGKIILKSVIYGENSFFFFFFLMQVLRLL